MVVMPAQVAAQSLFLASRIRRRWTRSVQSVAARICGIRSKNTSPELVLRRFLHGLGYRFRLHRKDLPGQPDLVFPGRRKVILCTVAFGINIRAAGKVGFQVPVSNTGNRNSSEIRPVMQLLNAS